MEETSVPCLASCVDCLESFRSVMTIIEKRSSKEKLKLFILANNHLLARKIFLVCCHFLPQHSLSSELLHRL